jgi:cell division protein ZapB
MAKIEELADRVERLLLRFDELSRTQQLVEAQLASVTQERDSLKSRLNAARSRIDALLDRLPTEAFAADALAPDAEHLAVTPPGHIT